MSTFNDTQNQILPYKECKNIYRTTTLGKRIVEGLVNFAMSTQREIDIHKAPPEAIEKFKETASEMKQDEAIKKTIYNARIYGTGALYIAMYDEEKEEDDFTTKPTFEDAYKYKIKFTVFDPLNISGARVDLDPLSFHFLEVVDIQVNSKKIPKKRIAISHALEPLYLDTRTSLIPYSPPSVFYNMVELLKQYDDAIKSIGDLLYKAGAIIYKYSVKSKLTGVTLDAITASSNILEQKRSGEVISISNDSTVEDFPIANLNGLIDSINKLEDDITKALSDTPVSILFDRNLSNGFSEGDKDKETVISTIESFRENKLTPLYNLTDYYIMLKAWDRAFIDEMRYKYSEYKDKTDNEIFRSWAENFKFKYGNLFPEPESVIQDNNAKKLDNLLKAKELGANPADLQEELNESEIFKNEMELNPQNMGGNEYDEEMFDYNNINSEIKADSDNNFKEEEHPRNPDGTFKKGTGTSVNSQQMELIEQFLKTKGITGKQSELIKEKLTKQIGGNKKKQQDKKESKQKQKEKDLKKKEEILKQDFYKDQDEYYKYLNDYKDNQNKIYEQYKEYELKEGDKEKKLKKEIDKWHNSLEKEINIKISSLQQAEELDKKQFAKENDTKIVQYVEYHDANIKKCYDNLEQLKTELKDIQSKKIENIKKNNNEGQHNKDNSDNTEDYKKNVQALPKDLQDIGEKLYSGKYKGGELIEGTNLSKLESSIFSYTQSGRNKVTEEQVDKIVKLIDNSPIMKEPLYRGQNGSEEIFNLKKGDDVPLFKINSFSSKKSVAISFAEGYSDDKPIIFVINKPCRALNIQPLSDYYDEEGEYFVGDGYKVDNIEDKYDSDFLTMTKVRYITISPKKEIK